MNLDNESSKIVFEDHEFQHSARPSQSQIPTSKITQLIIKYSNGYIKDEKQASHVLIGFLIVVTIISLFLFFSGRGSAGNPKDIKVLPAI